MAATHLKRVEGVTFLPLEGLEGMVLLVVSHYKHRGMVSATLSSMHLEATRRAKTSAAVYMLLARTVIENQEIEKSARQVLARSLIFSVLLSGAVTWPQLTAASARRIKLQRGANLKVLFCLLFLVARLTTSHQWVGETGTMVVSPCGDGDNSLGRVLES